MRVDTEYLLSDNPAEQKLQLEKYLKQLAISNNGTIKSWTPIIYGRDTAGTVTYDQQEGWYIQQGNIVDVWFHVKWTNCVGGVGKLEMRLPLKTWRSGTDFWAGTCSTSDLTYYDINHTYCVPDAKNDSYECEFISCSNGGFRGWIEVQATGLIVGHLRYLGQPEV